MLGGDLTIEWPGTSRRGTLPLVLLAVLSAAFIGWLIAGPWGAAIAIVPPCGLGIAWLAPEPLTGAGRRPRARASAADIGALTAEVGIGFAVIAPDQTIVSANRICEQLLGRASIAGVRVTELFASHDRPAIEGTIAALLRQETRLKDLRVETAASSGEPVLITLGRSPSTGRLFMSMKDDSLQMRLEAQMRQATKMQAVGQLAGGLAHDFNNILTAIVGHCDLMLMRHGPGDMDHHDADQIRQNANRAAGLIRQLLAFSRQQTLRARVVRIDDVVSDMSHLLRRLLGENVRLEVAHGDGLHPVRVDPGQIEQVLVNLAVNARDAMPGGGTLTLSTFSVRADDVAGLGHKMMPAADYVGIAVVDTGTGIAPDIQPNVFDPFFTTKDLGKGTGLGLAMAYGIVKQSGGFIFVEASGAEGTRFAVYLPAAVGEVPEVAVPIAAPAPLEGWGEGTILLVEDEAMVRAVAARALTRSGYDVLTAECGDDALAIMDARPDIDLLISDVVMLGMDGPTLVARAKAARPELRALFISGYAEEQVRSRVADPTTPLLRKPFSVQELSAAVRARLAA